MYISHHKAIARTILSISGGACGVFFSSIVVLCLLTVSSGARAELDCEEVLQVEQQGREFVDTSIGYQELKQNLINALLKQSVEQVLGKQITANSRSELSVHNDELEESLRTLTVDRAKGFITGYKILPPGEKLVEMGGVTVIELSIVADVCIPSYRGASYVIAMRHIVDPEGELAPASLMESVAAEITKNPRFSALRLPAPKDSYYDYELTGRVKSIEASEVQNVSGKVVASLFKALTKKTQRVDETVKKVTVEVAIQLKDVGDNTVSNFIGTGTETIGRRARKEELSAAVRGAMDAATISATKKMMNEF